MDKNIVRNWSNSTKPYLDKYIGAKFIYFHTIYIKIFITNYFLFNIILKIIKYYDDSY